MPTKLEKLKGKLEILQAKVDLHEEANKVKGSTSPSSGKENVEPPGIDKVGLIPSSKLTGLLN
jgi:hypothetical protein